MMFFNELIQVLFSYNGKINEKLKRAYTLDTYIYVIYDLDFIILSL